MRFRIVLLLWCIPLWLNAQNQRHQLINSLLEDLIENLPDDYDFSELEEQLIYFSLHPINLNQTNAKELHQLAFLSPLQINAILTHRQNYGEMIDVLELQQIEALSTENIRHLLPFVKVQFTPTNEKITYKNLIESGRHDLLIRIATLIETPKGFTNLPGNRYLGSKERLMMRYKFSFATKVSASLVLEKDAGEYLFRRPNQPLDFRSGHVALYKQGIFDKMILGDYTLQFGQGLTLWSGFSYGKAPDVASIVNRDIGLKAYTSANEYAFFRGAASQLQLSKSMTWTPFISSRKLDGSLDLDTSGNFTLSSINETGLHRTKTEIENKNTLSQLLFGNTLEYHNDKLTLGAMIYHQKFNRLFAIRRQAYTFHQFTGTELTNLGLHYHFSHKNTYFFGEISKGSTGNLAYLSGVLASLSSSFSTVLVFRNYAPNFHNFYSQAMAEGSESANENGWYAGFNFSPTKSFNFSFYIDYFRFPWLKFRVDAPSFGFEYLAQLSYTPNKRFKAIIKIQIRAQTTKC